MIPRLKAAARYIYRSERPWNWRLKKGKCPFCGGKLFVSFAKSAFHTRCLSCGSTAVNVSMIPLIKSHFNENFTGTRAYEMSSYGATFEFMRKAFSEMSFSEFIVDHALGEMVGAVRNEDATQLTFEDSSFDLVTSNQVFEHVGDDIRAYSECLRVLKPGGALIFTVPLYDTPTTVQVAQLSASHQIEWLGAPEFHDSRLGGPQSAPVFWRHSINDIASRVQQVGFSRATVIPVSILNGHEFSQPVVYATKP